MGVSFKMVASLSVVALGALAWAGCASTGGSGSSVKVVDELEIERYLGTWYELASVPLRAQRDCVGTTATYSLRDDGDIRVYNRCLKGGFDGKVSDITGRAWVDDGRDPAKLNVRFFWPFKSPYWVVALDADYRWAAVSGPDQENLWILSRTPCMNAQTFAQIYEDLDRRGFPVDALRVTPQQDENGKRCEVSLPPEVAEVSE
ncbi:hypothetical protein FRC96_14045 [Lujinxingia vulgaris]|uniref:Lipocalin/cytosolic fatty-acid binding domain-containing protein n=1 Tax=Lujinxingia vulgaris TaxID=2600176 RepID=A0A5C6XAX9_9DELT|nr:lipocalin family protein [Lujinxingia vulgaris]TXD34318.1 hypothetical protein FRC96_14045 [Lujinxingia vulgaris]